MFKHPRTQEEIFGSFGWWDKGCYLRQMTDDRGDYIESCVTRVYGKGALAQQEILEIGSGGGLICEDLARRQVVMTGIDPSAGALQTARLHARQYRLGQNIHYLQGVGEHLPFADGSFSVIVCLDVLEHVSDLKQTIEEIARVLAPGGIFVFDTITRTLLARAVLIWYGEHLSSGGLAGVRPSRRDRRDEWQRLTEFVYQSLDSRLQQPPLDGRRRSFRACPYRSSAYPSR